MQLLRVNDFWAEDLRLFDRLGPDHHGSYALISINCAHATTGAEVITRSGSPMTRLRERTRRQRPLAELQGEQQLPGLIP